MPRQDHQTRLPSSVLRMLSGNFSIMIKRPFVPAADDFVHLNLKPHRQRVGDDFFRQFALRNRRLAGGNRLQRFILLLRRERMHHEKAGTYHMQFMPGDFLFGPLIILNGADDKLISSVAFRCLRFSQRLRPASPLPDISNP